jgi:hypothetical protein
VATVPISSLGSVGDQAGDVAWDGSTYFYYCTANYDGSADIWIRIVGWETTF